MLFYSEQVVNSRHFGDISQLAFRFQRGVYVAIDLDPAGKPQQAGNALDNGGFPAPFGPSKMPICPSPTAKLMLSLARVLP